MSTTPLDIQKILKKEKLAELKNVSSNFHAYASVCLNQKKEKVYLKVRLYPKAVSRKNFAKEVILNKFLSENFRLNKYFISPKYYSSGITKSPEWLVREYTAGARLGDTWGFSKEFYQKTSPYEMAGALDFVRKEVSVKCKIFSKGKYSDLFGYEKSPEYKKYFLKYFPFMGKYIGPKEQVQVLKIFSKYSKLLSQNNCFTHGDLHPGNVVYNSRKIVLHDWKYAHWNNPYFDFTFVWFLGWLDEEWRGKLFKLEEKRAENKELFRIYFFLSVLRLTPKMISILTQVTSISKKDFERGIKKHLSVFKEAINYLSSH